MCDYGRMKREAFGLRKAGAGQAAQGEVEERRSMRKGELHNRDDMIPMPRRGKSEGDCTMSGLRFPSALR
jgi:hypothetical protein